MAHIRALGIKIRRDGSIVILPWSQVPRLTEDLMSEVLGEADLLARLRLRIEQLHRVTGNFDVAAKGIARLLEFGEVDVECQVQMIEWLAENPWTPPRERSLAINFLNAIRANLTA
jgi:hypothetical protein